MERCIIVSLKESYNQALEKTFTENSVNGTSFSTGDETIDFVSHVTQSDLE